MGNKSTLFDVLRTTPAVLPPTRLEPSGGKEADQRAADTQSAPVEEAQPFAPDERTIAVSYTTLAFVAMIAVGLMLGCFYAGIRIGRGAGVESRSVESSAAPQEGPPSPAPTANGLTPGGQKTVSPAVPAGPAWTIRLLEYPANSPEELKKAQFNADLLKQDLDRNGFPEGHVVSKGKKVVLYYGSYPDRVSKRSLRALELLRAYKYNSRALYQQADFVLKE